MANMREIRTRMKSIQDTMKITNAMYLISSSKLKKARKNLAATAPYFESLQYTIADILEHSPEIRHEFFDSRENVKEKERKRGYIVITADKGLAGAYNHNVIKMANEQLIKKGKTTLFVIGQMGRHYFNRQKVMVDCEFLYTAQDPSLYRAREIAETIIDLFIRHALDEVYIIFTKMVTPMRSEPQKLQILPLQRTRFEWSGEKKRDKYNYFAMYSPSPKLVLDQLVPNYVKGMLYGALVEAFSSEQNARMLAMQAATNSAKDMIRNLSLLYNRARQAAITQEITEIVSGAKAFKR